MRNNAPSSQQKQFSESCDHSRLANTSLRDLLASLSQEQKRNQELLISLAFSLRNFTNLDRFLELVPVIASRLVGVDGALLIPFHSDGRINTGKLHAISLNDFDSLIRHLLNFQQGNVIGFGTEEFHIKELDSLLQKFMNHSVIFGTSLVSRGQQMGRLYVFHTQGSFSFSQIHRRHIQLIADLAAVAIENHFLLQQTRHHETVDRQLSIGVEIQSQLLPELLSNY